MHGYRDLLWAVAGVVLSVGLAALLLTGGVGLLAGTAYLDLGDTRAVTPWSAVLVLVLGSRLAGA